MAREKVVRYTFLLLKASSFVFAQPAFVDPTVAQDGPPADALTPSPFAHLCLHTFVCTDQLCLHLGLYEHLADVRPALHLINMGIEEEVAMCKYC